MSAGVPQSQCLLNQVTHENNGSSMPIETIHELQPSSLPDVDSRKLITEANKSLANLLLEAAADELPEQTDSGICTVISSENTSLYDKSPEEKKSFANDLEPDKQQPHSDHDEEEEEENTSYSCSNLTSPRRRDPTTCVCSSRATAFLKPPSLEASSCKPHSRTTTTTTSSHEEIIGLAYGSGQLPVCDANQPSFHINYTDNWENLNLSIEASSSRNREFWTGLKCENCPQRAEVQAKQKRRHHRRKYEEQLANSRRRRQQQQQQQQHQPTSTESSRSNSRDRRPRLVDFGASLHPSQNSRRMPSFGSPHASPRMQHFEVRAAKSRKLLDHRRSRAEHQLQQRVAKKREAAYRIEQQLGKRSSGGQSNLINDGLGPRTNKSGIVGSGEQQVTRLRVSSTVERQQKQQKQKQQQHVHSSSSCSSCYDSSSETSEFQSDCQDDEEIALAMQAAEIANRNQIRSKFR